MKKIISSVLVVSSVILLISACSRDNIPEITDYNYNPATTSAGQENDKTVNNGNTDTGYKVNTAWMKNYKISYNYYNPEGESSTVSVTETVTDGSFLVEYPGAGAKMYYKKNPAGTDMYTVTPGENSHTLLSGKDFSSLSSLFMKLSAVDADMPLQNNVMLAGEETVAGRNCCKYIQRAYTAGNVTETVYVWVDREYGFAAKCQSFDPDGTLKLSWELTSFKTGGVTEKDAGFNVSDYKWTEVGE